MTYHQSRRRFLVALSFGSFCLSRAWAGARVYRVAFVARRSKVKVLVAVNEASLRAAKQATSTIPIVVIAYDHAPVSAGLIASMTRPGGNVTGTLSRQAELAAKRLELHRSDEALR